jgi:hypothetical protein
MSHKDKLLDLVKNFAEYLDRNDFASAGAFLADACVYHIRGKTLHGADAIIASYRDNLEAAKPKLDEIHFESRVERISPETYRIHYVDHLTKGGRKHKHQCQQVVQIAGDKITSIAHHDLPGEVESLKVFLDD